MTADYDGAIGRSEVWVAVRDGGVVGFVILVRQPDHLLLENVAADPAHQGTASARGCSRWRRSRQLKRVSRKSGSTRT
jgi:hypothetical protein